MFASFFKKKDPRQEYLDKWQAVKAQLVPPLRNGPELIAAVERWFAAYEPAATLAETLLNKQTPITLNDSASLQAQFNGMQNPAGGAGTPGVDQLFEAIKQQEIASGNSNGQASEAFRQFRKDNLYEMNYDLKMKVAEIKRRAPKEPTPAFVPLPPLPPPEDLQAKLNRLKAMGKGGRRKTRQRKTRKHLKKSRKYIK
jgi:hypothetical protein